MAENTSIEWCDHTWSPWEGCQKVGPGCDHCYAEARNQRFAKGANWGPGAPRRRTADWTKPLLWDRQAAKAGTSKRVFPSLCDPFDNEVPDAWRADLFRLIADTPHLDWLLLTKRIGNTDRMLRTVIEDLNHEGFDGPYWPWPNVWLGATIVNQQEADRDIPKLLATPAAVRFLSIEPMLGPIDLRLEARNDLARWDGCGRDLPLRRIDWVIVGGESGPHARPMHPDWARSLQQQCQAAGVAFFMKQMGGNRDKRGALEDLPKELRVREVPHAT